MWTALSRRHEYVSDMLVLHVQKDGEVPPDNMYRLVVQLLKVQSVHSCICMNQFQPASSFWNMRLVQLGHTQFNKKMVCPTHASFAALHVLYFWHICIWKGVHTAAFLQANAIKLEMLWAHLCHEDAVMEKLQQDALKAAYAAFIARNALNRGEETESRPGQDNLLNMTMQQVGHACILLDISCLQTEALQHQIIVRRLMFCCHYTSAEAVFCFDQLCLHVSVTSSACAGDWNV